MHVFCRAVSVASAALVLVSAADAVQKPITASAGWIKAPATGETSAAAFLTVENPTMYDVYLVSASSDAAAEVRFREGAAAAQPPVTRSEVIVPAFGSLEMKPDGVHLWLTGLERALKTGDSVTLTLTTDGNVTLEATATVK